MSRAGFQESAGFVEKLIRIIDREKFVRSQTKTFRLVDQRRVENSSRRVGRPVFAVGAAGQNGDSFRTVAPKPLTGSKHQLLIPSALSRQLRLSKMYDRLATTDHTTGLGRRRPIVAQAQTDFGEIAA